MTVHFLTSFFGDWLGWESRTQWYYMIGKVHIMNALVQLLAVVTANSLTSFLVIGNFNDICPLLAIDS